MCLSDAKLWCFCCFRRFLPLVSSYFIANLNIKCWEFGFFFQESLSFKFQTKSFIKRIPHTFIRQQFEKSAYCCYYPYRNFCGCFLLLLLLLPLGTKVGKSRLSPESQNLMFLRLCWFFFSVVSPLFLYLILCAFLCSPFSSLWCYCYYCCWWKCILCNMHPKCIVKCASLFRVNKWLSFIKYVRNNLWKIWRAFSL